MCAFTLVQINNVQRLDLNGIFRDQVNLIQKRLTAKQADGDPSTVKLASDKARVLIEQA